jgi:iron complex outermembrane receptor protein
MPSLGRLCATIAMLMLAATMAQAQTFESVIVTTAGIPGEPPVVAEARQRLSRTPGAVSVVAAEAYESRLATGFPDLLRDVPGVLSNKRYGEEARLSIRGSGLDQSFHQRGVLLAQDGVPFADADGFSDFQKVDAQTARYVEVYKGGNALRFGGAQLGGAVNMVTATGKSAPETNLLRLEGGSFGTVRGQAAIARDYDGFDFYASASGLSTDGFRVHSGQGQARATLNAGYSFGAEQEVRLILYGADIDQQVPGTVNLATALATPRTPGANVVANRWARDQQIARASLQSRWRFNDNLVFEGGVYATGTALFHPISIVIEQNIHTEGAFGRLDWSGDVAGHRADLFAGVSYRQGRNDSRLYNNAGGDRGFMFGDARQGASGTDIFAEGRFFATRNLALVAGASWGHAARDYVNKLNAANNASKNFEWFAPRLGLLWEDDSGVQLYANLTRSVEPPHYGALVQSPLPGFVPVAAQRAWTGEIGSRGRKGDFLWDVTFYRAAVKGEMLSFLPAAGQPANVFNAEDTIHQGVEASLDWELGSELLGGPLRLRQTYAWSDFSFDGDRVYGGNRLPVAPEHQYRLSLRYDDPSGFFVEPALDWRPLSTFVDYANTLKAPGYALFNMELGYRLNRQLSFFLDLRNLADTHYVAEFGAVTDARIAQTAVFYPGEGRAVYGGLRTTW